MWGCRTSIRTASGPRLSNSARLCPNPEDFKAWSQNLGHESVLTTLLSYGAVAPRRQGQIIQTLATGTTPPSVQAEVVAQAVVQALRGAGLLGGQG